MKILPILKFLQTKRISPEISFSSGEEIED